MSTIYWKTTLAKLTQMAVDLSALLGRSNQGGLLRVLDEARAEPQLKDGLGAWGYAGWRQFFDHSTSELQRDFDELASEAKNKPPDNLTLDYIPDFAKRLIGAREELRSITHIATRYFLKGRTEWASPVYSTYSDFASKYNTVADTLRMVKPELHSLSNASELEEWRLNHIPDRLQDLLEAP